MFKSGRTQQGGLRLADEDDHGCRGKPFHNADGQVDGQHQLHELGEGQGGDAGGRSFQNDGEGPQLKPDDGGRDACQRDAARAGAAARQRLVNEGVGHQAGEEAQVEDVAAQRQQAAVREEEGLDGQDGRHNQEACIGAEQDGQNEAAAQVSAGPGARNGEVQHLAGKDEGSQHAHERDEPSFLFLLDPACAEYGDGRRGRPHGAAYRR